MGLQVPLQTQKKFVAGIFDGLNDPVGSQSRDSKTGTHNLDSLMVKAVDPHFLCACQERETSSLQDADAVAGMGTRGALHMLDTAGSIGLQVLLQAAAAGDGQDLGTAANAQ